MTVFQLHYFPNNHNLSTRSLIFLLPRHDLDVTVPRPSPARDIPCDPISTYISLLLDILCRTVLSVVHCRTPLLCLMAHSPVSAGFMSAAGDRPVSRRAPDTTSFPTSRETGDVIPDTKQNPTIDEKESPFAKSWVHFVAGGYVQPDPLTVSTRGKQCLERHRGLTHDLDLLVSVV